MLYDDAAWHEAADGAGDEPPAAGATHIGLFLAWMLLNGQGSGVRDAHLAELARRDITPGAWFRERCGSKLTDREFSAQGNRFVASYYVLEDWRVEAGEPSYLSDYMGRLGVEGGAGAVPDDWASYDRLAPILAHRFALWRGLDQGRSD